METYGSIDEGQASEALASVRQTRARVAWSGYPAWYWLATGAGMGALCVTILLPGWWATAIPAGLAAGLYLVARAACRVRGVCEGWTRGAMTRRETAVLYGPATLMILASAAVSRAAPGASPWPSVAAAVVAFILFAGTGLMLGARAARP
jgi:hypothetical protein